MAAPTRSLYRARLKYSPLQVSAYVSWRQVWPQEFSNLLISLLKAICFEFFCNKVMARALFTGKKIRAILSGLRITIPGDLLLQSFLVSGSIKRPGGSSQCVFIIKKI